MDMQMVVRKLFAKAASTHSEHEAEAAILKAQELMAKYGIQDAGEENDIKYITLTCKHTGNRSFRRPLAKIIADNFRVKNYLRDMQVTFFGRENDVLIAKEAFEYTYSFICRESSRICRKMRENLQDTTGVVNSYSMGFCQGLKEKLDAQSVALMVVTPSDVTEKFEELSKDFGRSKYTVSMAGFSHSVYERGRKDGRDALERRRLEGKTA